MLCRVFKSFGTIDWREGRDCSRNRTVRLQPMRLADSVMGRRVKTSCGRSPVRSPDRDFIHPDRSQETAPTRGHKVTIPNVCGSDLLIAIFVTVHVKNRHRMNRRAALTLCACSVNDYCRIKTNQTFISLTRSSSTVDHLHPPEYRRGFDPGHDAFDRQY